MMTAAKLAAATAIVVLSAGTLMGVVSPQRGLPPVAGAPGDPGQPAIHWQSAIVDLQADSMTLQVGDEIYTTEGVDVVVDSYDGDLAQWSLYPRWVEGDETFWMYLNFYSDGRAWRMSPWIWREGVMGPGDGEYEFAVEGGYLDEYDQPPNAFIEFGESQLRVPLRQAYEGDWVLSDRLLVPTCGPGSPVIVDVTLAFENLRLAVSPRQPTVIDELANDWFHRGSMLGDLFNGHLEPPQSRSLECPASESE
jgi:hypothetical protein